MARGILSSFGHARLSGTLKRLAWRTARVLCAAWQQPFAPPVLTQLKPFHTFSVGGPHWTAPLAGSVACLSTTRGLPAEALTPTTLGQAALPQSTGLGRQAGEESTPSTSTSSSSSGSAGGGSGRGSTHSTSFRRVQSERRGQLFSSQPGVVHILNTFNNIILTLTDMQGYIRATSSAGQAGYKGSRKSQPVAAERAAEELAKKALQLGYSSVQVRLKGPGSNKQYAVQSLAAAGLRITSLADVTPIPYNGCRPPKKRRV